MKKREIGKSTFKATTFLPLVNSRHSGANYDDVYLYFSGVISLWYYANAMPCDAADDAHSQGLAQETDFQGSLTELHVQALCRMASG